MLAYVGALAPRPLPCNCYTPRNTDRARGGGEGEKRRRGADEEASRCILMIITSSPSLFADRANRFLIKFSSSIMSSDVRCNRRAPSEVRQRKSETKRERASERETKSEGERARGRSRRTPMEKESRGGNERDGRRTSCYSRFTYSPPRKRNKEIDRPSRGERRP